MIVKGVSAREMPLLLCLLLLLAPSSFVSALQGVCDCFSGYSLINSDCADYCQSAEESDDAWSQSRLLPSLYFPSTLDRYQSDHLPRFLSRGKRSWSKFACKCCDSTGNRACCSVCYEEASPELQGDAGTLLDKRSGIYWSDCCSATGSRSCCWISDVQSIAKRGNLQAVRLGGYGWYKRSNWQAARLGNNWRKRSNWQAARLGNDWRKRSNWQAARLGSWRDWKRSNRQAALMDDLDWKKRSNWQAARMGGWRDWKRSNRQAALMDDLDWKKRSNWQAALMGTKRDWKRSNRQAALMDFDWKKRSNWQAARMGGWLDHVMSKRVNMRGLGVNYCCRYDLPCCNTVIPYHSYYSPDYLQTKK